MERVTPSKDNFVVYSVIGDLEPICIDHLSIHKIYNERKYDGHWVYDPRYKYILGMTGNPRPNMINYFTFFEIEHPKTSFSGILVTDNNKIFFSTEKIECNVYRLDRSKIEHGENIHEVMDYVKKTIARESRCLIVLVDDSNITREYTILEYTNEDGVCNVKIYEKKTNRVIKYYKITFEVSQCLMRAKMMIQKLDAIGMGNLTRKDLLSLLVYNHIVDTDKNQSIVVQNLRYVVAVEKNTINQEKNVFESSNRKKRRKIDNGDA